MKIRLVKVIQQSTFAPETMFRSVLKNYGSILDCEWFGSSKMGRRDWFLVMTIPPHCSGSHLLKIFEQEWSNQRPILLRNVLSRLDRSLWTPEWFKNGTLSNQIVDLIDCREHIPVQGMTMKMFFDGFDKVDDTTVDAQTLNENENGLRPILKVKDWPPSADFQFILPDHFKDLEHKIPMSKFTDREGALNMAHHLPAHFSKPDLGPKMYIAYSSVDTPKAATTNLHMDISDAVNVLTYVAPVKTPEFKAKIRHILSEELKCGKEQLDRLDKETPGAIWHLYRPEDSNKLRSFIAKKKGGYELNHDPIHDQTNFLDHDMLDELEREFDVRPFTIVQFEGDGVFIPAGAPHMVRNLNSCIKVALDFVSPHGAAQCLLITEQLRLLSDTHVNREDKLQIKNIIYQNVLRCLNGLQSHQVSAAVSVPQPPPLKSFYGSFYD